MSDIHPKISIDQWRALLAVVETGGYAQAAEHLHKSQSSVTYAVKKMEALLHVKLFDIQGRKAVLTTTGQLLYRRAKALLQEATGIERAARKLSAGWEAEIGLAVEPLFPTPLLLKCLAQFGEESPHTRIELIESVLSGTEEALRGGKAELAISGLELKVFDSELLLEMRMMAVASPLHPLHQFDRPLTLRDLREYRHMVVRDSGVSRSLNVLALDAEQRWTVTNMSTSIEAVKRGYGFAWYPEDKIREELNTGLLKPLNLKEGSVRVRPLYLVYADYDAAGPGVKRLAQIIRDAVVAECPASELEHVSKEQVAPSQVKDTSSSKQSSKQKR
ncbi:MAG TPA: LysR family transcriptional regulator [Steroidobacteraceae bacterium]|jgi:DNA-binding transcriptional LysR family regulator|nr:LysR family transcriptional regulator [Steroidobacteraceae bacterium]